MITNVTDDTVSILEVRDGENWRRAYVNSEDGRAQLKAEFPDAYEELCGEGKPWGAEPTVQPIEADGVSIYPVAPRNITAGEYITVNGVLYKATENIPNGERIIEGQNAIETTVEAQLYELMGG